MTHVFKYDFAPTRAPPINLPNLNLPGSFGDLAYQGSEMLNWGMNNVLDLTILGFAAYGGFVLIPKMFNLAKSWVRKFLR